jgi:hypothetical protein
MVDMNHYGRGGTKKLKMTRRVNANAHAAASADIPNSGRKAWTLKPAP